MNSKKSKCSLVRSIIRYHTSSLQRKCPAGSLPTQIYGVNQTNMTNNIFVYVGSDRTAERSPVLGDSKIPLKRYLEPP